jgi:hypothetical protein
MILPFKLPVNFRGGLYIGSVAVTPSAAEINRLTGIPASAGLVLAREVSFTETTGAGVYTGSVALPAGASLLDIKVRSTALWTAATSATMKIGDDADDDGWFAGINLKATDLLVGEEINFVQTGGKEGAYLSTSTGLRSTAYSASARTITGIVTTVGTTGLAGRTRMLVTYVTPGSVTGATKV